jgi:hypothetical protein
MATKYIIIKSAGDFSFTTWPIYDGTVGHTEEYARRLARKVSATMKIAPELLEACEAALVRLLDPYLGEDDGERQSGEIDMLMAIIAKAKANDIS